MAIPGSTWQQLLQAIYNDFQRLDFLTQPTPGSSDIIWLYCQEAIAYFQPDIFIQGQAYLQWRSTFAYQKYYALPSDFETDGQIAFNVSGQNYPIQKISETLMNQWDSMIPATIGPSEYYTIYSTPANIFGSVTAAWLPVTNYTSLVPATAQTPPYLILDSNGNIQALQSVTGGGVSGATAPAWATNPGATTTDNQVTWLCWFNMSLPNNPVLRLFPTPDNVYPMTAIYQNIIPMPVANATSNFWTVKAEALIRHYTEGLIKKNVTHEPTFQADFDTAELEFAKLSGEVRKASGVGRARPCYL